jgi:two-component system, LytTR family, sensor kinase
MVRLKKKDDIGYSDFWLIAIGVPVLAFLVPLLFYGIEFEIYLACFRHSWFVAIPYVGVLWLGDRTIMMLAYRKFPSPKQNTQRLALSTLFIFIYTAIITALMHGFTTISQNNNPFIIKTTYAVGLVANLFTTVAIIAIYEALFYWAQFKKQLVLTERLQSENSMAQLEALKNQVNPHFLFNSLNTLVSIIPEDANKAVAFVQQLSTTYRHLLDLNGKKVVSLEEEMELLQSYIFLLRTRFGDSLFVDFQLEEDCLRRYLIPLSLQLLVENAVKHNIISQKKPLHIRIYTTDSEWICVENNLQLKAQEVEGTKTGLTNINERFWLTFERTIDVEKTDTSFRVTIPLITIDQL